MVDVGMEICVIFWTQESLAFCGNTCYRIVLFLQLQNGSNLALGDIFPALLLAPSSPVYSQFQNSSSRSHFLTCPLALHKSLAIKWHWRRNF